MADQAEMAASLKINVSRNTTRFRAPQFMYASSVN